MKKSNTLIIRILFISLGLLLIVYFSFNRPKPKRYQWQETYQASSDQPYGTQFIKELLASYRPGQKFIINDKKPLSEVLDSSTLTTKTDYVLVGQHVFLDDADREALLSFIASGNDAFISTVNLPFALINHMFVSECNENPIYLTQVEMTRAQMNFYNVHLRSDSGYTYVYHFKGKDLPYYWNSLNPQIFCDSTTSITPLGFLAENQVNFFKLSYGDGNLFIHTNPLVFTNYFLTTPEKARYASHVFSHLSGEAMIWDEFSKSEFVAKNNAPEMSPIAFLLQQESLRYAWWMMLAAVIVYVLFTAKRRQRVIPVLEEKTNTSLEFIDMISTLHFQKGNHLDIARKKVKYFFHSIRVKYNIHTQTLSELYLKRLAEKSKVSTEDLETIALEFKKLEHVYYTENNLIELHKALDKFYKYCK